MIKLLISLLPFMFLFIGAILAMAYNSEAKKSHSISISSIILSLLSNTVLLIYLKQPIRANSFYFNPENLWISEIVLIGLLIISISIKEDLYNSQQKENIYSNYLFFSSTLMGFFITENLLILSIFYILAVLSLGSLFTLGDYKKNMKSLQNYFNILIIVVILLIITNIIIEINYNTLNLTEIKEQFSNQTETIKYFTFISYTAIFGIMTGVIPFALYSFKQFILESNQVCLKALTCIFLPLMAIIIIKITSFALPYSRNYSLIYFFIGLIGFLAAATQTIIELFGNHIERTKSINLIIGYFSIAEFNIFLILTSLKGFAFTSNTTNSIIFSDIIMKFFILSILSKIVLISAITPILNSTKEWDLKYLGGYFKHFPKFIGFLIIIPLIYLFPTLIGNEIYYSILKVISDIDMSQPVQTAQLWSIGAIFGLFLIVGIIINATFLNEIFFGKDKQQQYNEDISRSKKKIHIYMAISIFSIVILLIFSYIFPYVNPNILF